MADEPDKSEKTEDPSQKKIDDAIKRGDVIKSQELTTWFMIFGSLLLFALMAPIASASVMRDLRLVVANADQFDIGSPALTAFFWGLMGTVMVTVVLPLGAMALFAIAANMVQHPPVMSWEPMKPSFSKISPLAGAKRLFSSEALVNFGKGLFKLVVVGTIMFFVLWPESAHLDVMMTADPLIILEQFQSLGIKLFAATLAIITIIAAADYAYQRYKWWEKLKMTQKEVKDEYKQMEGDPQIKSRIRQIRQQRAQKRMMAAVPTATVVITNPTHFAVALKYDREMKAPLCVAKGMDAVALRIRTLATESDVPIVENPPLARALYKSVEIDGVIPEEHFKAVAQVIGYVMRLKNRSGWRGRG